MKKQISIGLFFFFQAEDGIRDPLVTGVQTCALPIFDQGGCIERLLVSGARGRLVAVPSAVVEDRKSVVWGKSVDLGGRRIIKKKKKIEMATSVSYEEVRIIVRVYDEIEGAW